MMSTTANTHVDVVVWIFSSPTSHIVEMVVARVPWPVAVTAWHGIIVYRMGGGCPHCKLQANNNDVCNNIDGITSDRFWVHCLPVRGYLDLYSFSSWCEWTFSHGWSNCIKQKLLLLVRLPEGRRVTERAGSDQALAEGCCWVESIVVVSEFGTVTGFICACLGACLEKQCPCSWRAGMPRRWRICLRKREGAGCRYWPPRGVGKSRPWLSHLSPADFRSAQRLSVLHWWSWRLRNWAAMYIKECSPVEKKKCQ